MKLNKALNILESVANDYGTPLEYREAIHTVLRHFEDHPVVDAADFFAAMERSKAAMAARRAAEDQS